ncbi:MAG: hypothetical protein WCL51_06270 [Bacteroidota bacterium]
MDTYLPPIKERETEDLIYIYISPTGDWQEDAKVQAKEELLKRGITNEELRTISSNYKRCVDEEERKHQEQMELNATESYSIFRMMAIFLCVPLLIAPNYYPLQYLKLADLKQENYKIKYKQRLYLEICGAIFWFFLFRFMIVYRY